jgi:hypothetical protein
MQSGRSTKHIIKAFNSLEEIQRKSRAGKNTQYESVLRKVLNAMYKVDPSRYPYMDGERLKAILMKRIKEMEIRKQIEISKIERKILENVSFSTIKRYCKKYEIRSIYRPSVKRYRKKHVSDLSINHKQEMKVKIGCREVDTIHMNGGTSSGKYIRIMLGIDKTTLMMSGTGYISESATEASEALYKVLQGFVYDVKIVCTDNGSEFLNQHSRNVIASFCATHYCSRPGESNDNAYIENANRIMREMAVGYLRFNTRAELEILNKIIALNIILNNYCKPRKLLISKGKSLGNKYSRKKYDQAKIPFERACESSDISEEIKKKMIDISSSIDEQSIHLEICQLMKQLSDVNTAKLLQYQETMSKNKSTSSHLQAWNSNF